MEENLTEDRGTPVVIGVDVGGTNTDAVVMSLKNEIPVVLSSAKSPTTSDITSGIQTAIRDSINKAVDQQIINVTQVNVGTTQLLNAVIEKKGLARVAVIRLCGEASHGTPPFSDIPDDIREIIDGGSFMVSGGYEFDGREIATINLDQVNECLEKIDENDVTNIVICGIFSSVNPDQEIQVKNFICKTKPKYSVTISSEIGQNALLQRENSAILNECLRPLCKKTVSELKHVLDSLDLMCPLYLSQNDGTILSTTQAMSFPVLTFACGPTNSIRGAAFLTGLDDGIVIDVGGTTTDIGVLYNGFPRQSYCTTIIGNIRTNLRMPDVSCVRLGGGSYVNTESEAKLKIGPQSAGVNIQKEGITFSDGNDEERKLTVTDIAVSAGLCKVGNPKFCEYLDERFIIDVLATIKEEIEMSVEKMKMSSKPLPVIVVGGGHVILDTSKDFKGASVLVCPQHAKFANAIGAAICTISDTDVYCVKPDENVDDKSNNEELIDDLNQEYTMEKQQNSGHDVAIQKACNRAKHKLVRMGAKEASVKVTDKEIVHNSSASEGYLKVKIGVVGMRKTQKTQSVLTRKLLKHVDRKNFPTKKQTHTSTGLPVLQTVNESDLGFVRPKILQNKEWVLTERDIECITIGAGILGCGGGGSAHLGRLLALKAIKEGKTMKVADHMDFCERSCRGNEVAVIIAIMGSPTVLEEKTVHNETINALNCLQDVLKDTGALDCVSDESNEGVKSIHNLLTSHIRERKEECGKRISALMCVEMGGMNTIVPLLVAADLNLPVLDCDGMGRAFPELQMIVPFIYGCSPYPATLSDCKNRRAVVIKVNTVKQLEDHFRKVVVEMGGTAGIAFAYLDKEEIMKKTVPNSLSRAWFIGDAVQRAKFMCKPPVDAIISQTNGKLLISGKVVLVSRDPSAGFNNGKILFESLCENQIKMKIDFHNENIISRIVSDERDEDGEIVASVPDLITIVDNNTGESIPNENIRYGMFASVLLLPASSMLKTAQALQFVGPKAFGYSSVEQVPCSDFDETISVIGEFYRHGVEQEK